MMSVSGERKCEHGQGPNDIRCVTECFGASLEGPQTMISRCMLCGATRLYRVLDYVDPPAIEYGPWREPVQA